MNLLIKNQKMSSSLVDLWSVVSGLSLGGLFMYFLFSDGITLNVNVNHNFVVEENCDVEEEVVDDESVEENYDDESVELEVDENDNDVVENENNQ